MKVNEAKASAAAIKGCVHAMTGEVKAPKAKWRLFFRKSPLQNVEAVVKDNMYDRGAFSNVGEILIPLSERRSFLKKKTS